MNTERNGDTQMDDLSLAVDDASHGGDRPAAPAAATGSAAQLNQSHALISYLDRLGGASASSRVLMAIGELAVAMDNAADGRPFVIAVSAIQPGHRLGQTALSLAALWGRWGRSACLIDLGTGRASLGGAIVSTSPDLGQACALAEDGGRQTLSSLHARFSTTTVISRGQADVLGLISTGRFGRLIDSLKKSHERIVVAAPPLAWNFPFLGLGKVCDRLVLSLVRGKSRGGPIRELAEQAMAQGLRPIEAIWYE